MTKDYNLGKIHGLEEAARMVRLEATKMAKDRAAHALGEFVANKTDRGTSTDATAFDVRHIGDEIAHYALRLRGEERRKKIK